MKGLLGMARQKRKEEGKQFKPLSKLNLANQQHQAPNYQQEEEEDQDYEPDEEQVLVYGEYIGIMLPQQEQLLYIAREGLMADLPPEWINEQTDDGQIIYTNVRTGQRTLEHPCDEYYRQLVIKERRRLGINSQNRSGFQPVGLGSVGSNSQMGALSKGISMVQPPKDVDPLVKMQMQKKKKKMEEMKRKEYEDKKKVIKQKYERKREQLEKDMKQKQRKAKEKYDQELESERRKLDKKMSEKQKEEDQKMRREMEKYEREARSKIEKLYHDKKAFEQERIEKKMRAKREELRLNLQNDLKKQKKELEDEYKAKLKILTNEEKLMANQKNQKEMIEQEKINLRASIIEKKLQEYSDRLKQQKQDQNMIYKTKLSQLEEGFERKIKGLETQAPKHQIKFDSLVQQIQQMEREELKSFQYELSITKEFKKAENEQKIQIFKQNFMKEKKKNFDRLDREYEEQIEKYRKMKEQQQQAKVSEAQKKIKEEYLASLKSIQSKYSKEEEIIMLQGKGKNTEAFSEKQQMSVMSSAIEKYVRKEETLAKQIQAIRKEISRIGHETMPVKYKLNQDQLKMYTVVRERLQGNVSS